MTSAVVITCSNRSAAGTRADDSGSLLATAVQEWGFELADQVIVADDVSQIQAAVRAAVTDGARLVLTTGGTGVTPTDVTPEAVLPLLDKQILGIAERLRMANADRVPTAVLSRGVAGLIGTALVVTLPGSPGGVSDGIAVLAPLVHHVLDQVTGGDHRAGGGV
jgi:molybdenum cofactor synthesis domain-containing protein